MKPHELIEGLMKADKVNGMSLFHSLQIEKGEKGEYYLTDCDAYAEDIPEDWNEAIELIQELLRIDMAYAYQVGQNNLRKAVKELLNITV